MTAVFCGRHLKCCDLPAFDTHCIIFVLLLLSRYANVVREMRCGAFKCQKEKQM